MKKGKLIVFSGPSGVGKGSIRHHLTFDDYVYSISSTTRLPREGEVDGVDYNFISKEEFENKINQGEMLEYAEFVGNYYGTDKQVVEELLNSGKNVLLEIECNGAMQVLDKVEDVVSIFVLPPSLEVLEQRLTNRNTEDENMISLRLKKAQEELGYKDRYQYHIINDDLKNASAELDKILYSECSCE